MIPEEDKHLQIIPELTDTVVYVELQIVQGTIIIICRNVGSSPM